MGTNILQIDLKLIINNASFYMFPFVVRKNIYFCQKFVN